MQNIALRESAPKGCYFLDDRQAVYFNTQRGYPVDMPRVDDSSITTVVFLYPTRESAERNEALGGTGFMVGKPALELGVTNETQRIYIPYIVSNLHVAHQGAPYIRINNNDGSTHIIDRERTDWITHPDGDDLAATCVFNDVDPSLQDLTFVRESEFITPEKITAYDLGLGEDTFMVGRFINHQGRNKISPALRMGNLSMMVEPIWVEKRKRVQECFAVEMRSRTGFSGSPVYVYRTVFTNIARTKTNVEDFKGLLGVNFGFVYDENGENTWLNGVIPAWKISELLNEPSLQKEHKKAVEKIQKDIRGGGVELSGTTDNGVETRRDETLGRMLNTPPKPRKGSHT